MTKLAESLLQIAITLREGVEIALILAIMFAFLTKTGRQAQFRAVWMGVGIASALCIAAAVGVFSLVGELSGTASAVVEGTVMVLATGVITWMIFWMRSHARVIKGELHGGLAAATTSLAVGAFAAMAVVREGFETVMILISAGAASASPVLTIVSSFIGFGLAAAIGVAIYKRGMRLDLQRFFRYTGIALIAFATYSLAYGLHEFAEIAPANGETLEIIGFVLPAIYAGVMLRWFLKATKPVAPRAATPVATTAAAAVATEAGTTKFTAQVTDVPNSSERAAAAAAATAAARRAAVNSASTTVTH